MASLALGVAGAAVGGALFGPWGVSIGWALGSAAGNIFFAPKTPATLHDLHIQGSSYGAFAKRFWGKVRIAGCCIWQTDQQQHDGGGKGGKGQPGQPSFVASWDTMICETQVAKLCQIFDGGRLNYDVDQPNGPKLSFTFYDGNPDQLPDPTEEAVEGAGNVPAYRGISRIVYHDRDMTNFGNTLPQESYVVVSHQGDIPFRVSTFDPAIDSEAGPYNIVATLEDGIITVGTYSTGTAVTYSQRQFLIDGTPTGTPTTVSLDVLPFSTPVNNEGGTVANLQACCCFSDNGSGDTDAGWFVKDQLVAVVSPNPGGGFMEAVAINGVYLDGFIYAIDIIGGGATGQVRRWAAPDGIPDGSSDLFYTLGPGTTNFVCHVGDSSVWVTNGALGTDDALYQFDVELNLIHVWTHAELPVTWPTDMSHFVFYHGMIAGNFSFGGTRKFAAYKVNADFTFTLIGDILQDGGGENIQLHNGLVLGRDGVVSLDPPDGSVMLSEVVGDICDDVGQSSYNVSQLSAIPVDGVIQEAQTTGRALIEMLMPVYFFDAVESDGVVKFVVRGGAPVVTFLEDDLAAHMDHDGLPSKVTCVHTPDVDLPSALAISYINKDADYQVNTQTWQRMTGGSRDVKTITVPIVLTDAHAKKIVDAWGWNAWSERDAYSWQTSRKYAAYEPTDVCFVDGVVPPLRITKKTEGATGVIKWEGVPSVGANFDQAGAGGAAKDPGQVLTGSQAAKLLLLDIPLVKDTDVPGLYSAMAGIKNPAFPGAGIFESTDSTTYARIATVTSPAVIGTATTVLGDFFGGNVFDELNMVTVKIGLGGGTLTSTDETAVLNGANMALIGFEIVQFKNADLIAASTYALSGLLRGRRGTEYAMDAHFAGTAHTLGERFVLLPTTDMVEPTSDLGQTRFYKGVMAGQTLAGTTALQFVNNGQAVRPYSPAFVGGGINAAGDATINFVRRTRIGGDWQGLGEVPLSEAVEGYVVEIWDATYTLCARVIETTAQTATYTSAQQVTDFGAQQQTLFVTAAQKGSFHLGVRARGTIPGAGGSNGNPLVPVTPYESNPIVSPPPPTGGTRPVDYTFTFPVDYGYHDCVIPHVFVGKFTTDGTAGRSGAMNIAEYQSANTTRKAVVSSDSGGLLPLAPPFWGDTISIQFGPGANQIPLTTGTVYYVSIEMIEPNNTPSGPLGYNSKMVINFNVS